MAAESFSQNPMHVPPLTDLRMKYKKQENSTADVSDPWALLAARIEEDGEEAFLARVIAKLTEEATPSWFASYRTWWMNCF